MAYVLTLIAALAGILWVSPAHQFMARNFQTTKSTIETMVASGSAPLTARIHSSVDTLRTKSMELLRKELHRGIEDLVK